MRKKSLLIDLVMQATWLFQKKIAIITPTEALTYAQVRTRLLQLAELFSSKTKIGDRVIVCMHNDAYAALLPLALWSIGRVSVPLNWRSSPFEIANIIKASNATMVVHDELLKSTIEEALSFVEAGVQKECALLCIKEIKLPQAAEREEEFFSNTEALASINFTSGTLGAPKGVMMNQNNWEVVYRNILSVRGFKKSDVVALPGPLSHAAGAYVIPLLLSGATIFLPVALEPFEFAHDIEKHKVTVLYCVPTLLSRLIRSSEFCDIGKKYLRQIIYGAESIPFATLQASINIFGPILAQNYGLTEAMMTCVHLPPDEHVREDKTLRYGVLGRPYHFVEVVLRRSNGEPIFSSGEVGEVTIRSPHTMMGYWNNQEQTNLVLRDGWIWSGDLARWNDENYIELVGRNKDMIVCGGMNMYPAEVQKIVSGLPGVIDCAVFGIPSKEWGEELVAALVIAPNTNKKELRDVARSLLGIRTPKQWLYVDELPRTLNGKTDIPALRHKLVNLGDRP